MVEVTIDPKTLEDAILKALTTLFPETTTDPAVEFYKKFHRAADDRDRDLINKYTEDVNNMLIVAGLFSTVTSAFIIDIQSKLEPDFQEMNNSLLKIVASAALGNISTGADVAFPEWNGPDSTVVRIQAILYSSLAVTLFVTFTTMLVKQWLNRYASLGGGSIIDRGRRRKRKMDGINAWKLNLVMECLPLALQLALLLFGYALSDYLFSINKTIAGVVTGFTLFGALFYLQLTYVATLSYNCPFQTPISLLLRSLLNFDYKKYVKDTLSNHPALLQVVVQAPLQATPQLPPQPRRLFEKDGDQYGYVLDSKCIARMFEMSTEIDTTTAIARYIPEIFWHHGIQDPPLEKLYDAVLECFDRSSGLPILKPAFKDKAYLSARALLHIGIQRKYTGGGSDDDVFEHISRQHKPMGSKRYESDSDTGSTLSIIDHVFGALNTPDGFEPMGWENLSFTPEHHTWMAHILLHHAWDIIRTQALPDYIRKFILHSLRSDPVPQAKIVADCLFIIGLTLGIGLHADDLSVRDKSSETENHIQKIYGKLAKTFRNLTPAPDEIQHALEAMELIAPLSNKHIARESYKLFHVIMARSPLEESDWNASRLAMYGAYKSDKFLPEVGDPGDVLAFLEHHFDLATTHDKNQDGPIQHALRALIHVSDPSVIQARAIPKDPSFAPGILHVFQGDRPFQLRTVALRFLALISEKWFDPGLESGEMRNFCAGWASFVDSVEPTAEVEEVTRTVFLRIISSPDWCGYMVREKWNLLERFTPDDPRLSGRISNPELMDEIKNTEDRALLTHWLKILWLRHGELGDRVREQLEETTKEFVDDGRKTDLAVCLSAIDLELKRVERMIARLPPISPEHQILVEARYSAIGARDSTIGPGNSVTGSRDSLTKARESLVALMNPPRSQSTVRPTSTLPQPPPPP